MLKRKTQQSRRYFNSTHKRDNKGRFISSQPKREYYSGSNIPEYITSPDGIKEKMTYRAVVTLNGVPIHSDRKRGKPRYKSFSWAKVGSYEDIDIDDMKKKLLQEIANHFRCKVDELWFHDGDKETYFDIEYPKPYRGSHYEGLEVGEY